MTRKRWVIAVVVFAVLAVVVLLDRHADNNAPGVDPSAKTQIDRLAAEHDCTGLQAWFDATTNAAPKQLSYINDKMEDAGCYDD